MNVQKALIADVKNKRKIVLVKENEPVSKSFITLRFFKIKELYCKNKQSCKKIRLQCIQDTK